MKRRQKRFTTEAAIIGEIDLKKKTADELLVRSIDLDKFHDNRSRDESEKLNKRRNRILQVQLPRLKNALAEFRTVTMPFCGDDKGVVLK
jgi:uncharacterized protein YceH (UPF0502 family)